MQSEKQPNPLVSIIVITYNSSKYVLETLESAKAQTYKDIELIVSDDASTDNTVEMCQKWIEKNNDRFADVQMVTVEKNAGISANCNRGLERAKGVWVKLIAGDDILTATSVESFIAYSWKNPDANFIFGAVEPFCEKIEYQPILAPREFIATTAKKQHLLLLKKDNCILGPASFIKRSVIKSIGGFDSRIAMQEDYPLWLKATFLEHKLYFDEFVCARYRIHKDSLTSSSYINSEVNSLFLESFLKMQKIIKIPYFLKNKLYFHSWHQTVSLWRNKRKGSGINKFYRYCSYLIDPIGLYYKFLHAMNVTYKYHFKYITKED